MSEELTPPRFPTMLRKMWSGGEVQAWIDENWNRRAHPAAPADAAPSVAPEPVAWEGGEGWESLAWELCADENGEDACNELIWEGAPSPEPWGDRWMKYEGEAKRLIALVHKHAAHPPRAPAAYIEGVNIDRLKEALTFLGAAYDSDEMLAARLAEHVNRLTQCVMRSKVLLAAPSTSTNGWLEAAVAWEVCASIHLKVAKGKDALFTVRQGDFVKHAADAREKATAPSVAPEPVAWTLQSELDAAQTTCSAHLWFTNPRNSAWTALFTREQIAAHPPRAPLTEEQRRDLVKECGLDWQRGYLPLLEGDPTNRYAVLVEAVEAAHGIGGK